MQRARRDAAEFKYEYGYEIPVHYLAKKLADENQVRAFCVHVCKRLLTAEQLFTQHASKRTVGCTMILGAVDDEAGPQIFRVDPAGHFVGFKACSAGVKEQEAMNWLEKKVRHNVRGHAAWRLPLHQGPQFESCLSMVDEWTQ